MNEQDFEEDIRQSLEILKKGGTILYPTDTVWGIGCDATNAEAVEKIFTLKKRPSAQTMIILLADVKDLNVYTSHLHPQVLEYLEQTTRPTTVIYEGAIGIADNLIQADGTIAIRIVKEEFCRHLIKRLRKPLVSTSANISGEKTAATFKDISKPVLEGVDYVVRYRQSETEPGKPSAIVKFDRQGHLQVLR